MNLLLELNSLLSVMDIPLETGVFTGIPPEKYLVITPMIDTFGFFADDKPQQDIQEARISLYSKGNYITTKNKLIRTLLGADFTITDRSYIGHEDDTSYHHYSIDVSKYYEMEE